MANSGPTGAEAEGDEASMHAENAVGEPGKSGGGAATRWGKEGAAVKKARLRKSLSAGPVSTGKNRWRRIARKILKMK